MVEYLFDMEISHETYQDYFTKDANVKDCGDWIIARFRAHRWAPGVWAGTEGLELKYIRTKYVIKFVDFDNKILVLRRV